MSANVVFVSTCWYSDGDEVRHVVLLWGLEGSERVAGGVGGTHLESCRTVRTDAELHQAPLVLQNFPWKKNQQNDSFFSTISPV